MTAGTCLAFPGRTHAELLQHLYPGDGLEAAAVLVCAQTPGPRFRLVVQTVVKAPYEACKRRTATAITWPGACVEKAIALGEEAGLVLIPIHSHPGGLFDFSETDDASDRELLPLIFAAYGQTHGSAIMTPDGAVRARLYDPQLKVSAVDVVMSVGDDIRMWWLDGATVTGPAPRPVAFTSGMTAELSRLTAAVIGVSGTGSVVGEQVARLGFGRVILIDFDVVEEKNLNRILNTTIGDARAGTNKAVMFAGTVGAYRGEGVATAVPLSIADRSAVLAASQADVLFSCVDTLEARHLADRMAAAFVLPLFDMGVTIPTRSSEAGPEIADVCGRLDYVQPGGSTLKDRSIYTADSLQAEYDRRADPAGHQQQLEEGYIKGLPEEAPAVIALNMRAASASVLDFIARFYPFRHDPNGRYAQTRFSLAVGDETLTAESAFTRSPNPLLGTGAAEPLLGLPRLSPPVAS